MNPGPADSSFFFELEVNRSVQLSYTVVSAAVCRSSTRRRRARNERGGYLSSGECRLFFAQLARNKSKPPASWAGALDVTMVFFRVI